jgi:hypothetical protein
VGAGDRGVAHGHAELPTRIHPPRLPSRQRAVGPGPVYRHGRGARGLPRPGGMRCSPLPVRADPPAGISVADGFRAAYEGITGEPQHPYCEIGSVMEHGPPHWNAGNLVQAERRLALVLAAMGVQTSPERLQPPGPLSAAPVRPAFDCPAASHTPSWFPHPPSARWSNRPYLRRSAGPAQTQPLHAGSTGGKATAPKVARVIPAWE